MTADVDYVVDTATDPVEAVGIAVCPIASELVAVSLSEKNAEYILNGGTGTFDLHSTLCIRVGRCP
jgi:hypothetical protein